MPGAPASIATLPAVGDVIAGKYTILRTIGEGGMGVVYEAMHVRLRQRLAIKVLRPEVGEKGEVLARFAREARITAQLRSIHSARVIDVDHLPNGLPYIVLEYLEGCDLEDELLAKGALPVAEAVDIVIQVADAMKEAHDLGIVHRDLKPANLFVCRPGPRRIMKILDFGISRVETGETRITLATSYVGTPHYAAPEQLRDASGADARSDVWSLGVVLFELLTGVAPFNGSGHEVIARVMVDPVPSPCDQRADLPPELGRVVLRALQRDPALRYQSMTELSTALAPFGPAERAADTVADLQRTRGRLGEILVADGLIAASDLERALAEQARTGRMLGRVLLDLGLVAHADLLAALAKQQGLAGGAAPVAAGGERSAPIALPVSRETPRSGWRKVRRAGAWLAVAAVLWIGSLLVAVAAAR
jgi:serine/threonine-protein kinase